jgi:hypothetical protein
VTELFIVALSLVVASVILIWRDSRDQLVEVPAKDFPRGLDDLFS